MDSPLNDLSPSAISPPLSKAKRDEWSEGGIRSLLEIYESKWRIRNRAKLKGSDWEEIAQQVSIHYPASKTPSQCKNKIESMKKRYRAEAAASAKNPNSISSWHFFARMDGLLKGAFPCPGSPRSDYNRKGGFDLGISENFHGSCRDHGSDSSAKGFSSPRVSKKMVESVRVVTDLMLRIEKGRMEMFRDSERVRAEAEIRKWEMELKRTEIVAKTQLQIAKLVMKRFYGKGNGEEGSALKTELDMLSRREVMGD